MKTCYTQPEPEWPYKELAIIGVLLLILLKIGFDLCGP